MIEQQRARLYAQIRDAQAKLEQLQTIPQADTYKHGDAVRVKVMPRYTSVDEYVYVFLKIQAEPQHESHWYFTGELYGRRNRHERWAKWETIVSWLISDVELVSWEDLAPKDNDLDMPALG